MLEQYSDLTQQACARYGPLDLVVWPESMFPLNDMLVEPGVELELDPSMDRATIDDNIVLFERLVRNGIRRVNDRAIRKRQTLAPRAGCWVQRRGSSGIIRHDATTPRCWSIRRRRSRRAISRCTP